MDDKNENKNEELQKAYELNSVSEDFIPDTSVGKYRFLVLLFLLVLGTVAAFAVMRFLQMRSMENRNPGNFQNPLLGTEENKESDIPDIPGVRVYDVGKDISELEKDASLRNEQYRNGLEQMGKERKNTDELEAMKARDSFAAEKLALLKKIENAKNKEERTRLIKELEKRLKSGEKN